MRVFGSFSWAMHEEVFEDEFALATVQRAAAVIALDPVI
jgi:hypothetical protein